MYRKFRPFYTFSKTSFVRGMQCYKLLYLDKYKSGAKTPPDKETLERFERGREFEAGFKDKFPQGIDLKALYRYPVMESVEATKELLSRPGEVVVFEAAVFFADILVLTDVLRKNADGSIDIFEVKHSDQVNSAIEWDLSLQYYVCKNALPNVRTFNLVNRVGEAGYAVSDWKSFAEERLPQVESQLAQFRTILQGFEPDVPMGEQCDNPYKCDFKEYCQKWERMKAANNQ